MHLHLQFPFGPFYCCCSSPKHINIGVPQGSVLSPILFLLFINDLLHLTQCSIYSYADDITLYFSMSYNRHPTQQEFSDSRWNAIARITSDLSLVCDWDRANLVLFNASKTQFLQLSTWHNLSHTYPLFSNDTQLSLSSTLNTLGQFFTKSLNWQFHISTHAKSASKKVSVLPFFSPFQPLALYKGLIHLCMEYGFHVCSTHTALLNRVESKAFCLINSPPLTNCLDSFKSLTQCSIFIPFLPLFSCWLLFWTC